MRKFPKPFRKSFKPRFVPLVEKGIKRQTIRPYPKRACDVPIVGDIIIPFSWEGATYRSKQIPILGDAGAEIKLVVPVLIEEDRIFSESEQTELDKNSIAKADGFKSWEDMRTWFIDNHKLPFKGILIRW